MGTLVALPARAPVTLAELATAPSRVAEVPPEAVPGLLAQAAALQGALAARLVTASPAPLSPSQQSTERLLTPAEAAELLKVSVPWLHRHAKHLPFTRRLSRKALRFSEAGIRRWLDMQRS
jgi:predicted DNA-binding transcriptional regulator AlpA